MANQAAPAWAAQPGHSTETNLGAPEAPNKLPVFGVEPEPGTPAASAGRGENQALRLKLPTAA
eukprot:7370611-Alexandrium_andersonii.AAC.1